MSLVAYDASSDEEDNSDNESQENSLAEISSSTSQNNRNKSSTNQVTAVYSNGHISDEEDENLNDNCTNTHNMLEKIERKGLHLPIPKNPSAEIANAEERANIPIHLKLPTPKTSLQTNSAFEIVEEDDEFLHKKEIGPPIEKPPPPKKQPVKITIPSLNQFMDFKVENKKETAISSKNSASLLAILPDPQNENVFNTKSTENSKRSVTTTKVTSLIPDHVKNRNKVKSIKDSPIIKKQNSKKPSTTNPSVSDSEESDEDENKDFFSLNRESKLPEVSDSEIKAMVEKKVAEMTKVSKKIDEMVKTDKNQIENDPEVVIESSTSSVDKFALQALVGASQAKRQKFVEEAQIVEISSEQVLPNREEWLRASLTAETSYQPRGVLVDEEPAPGTRKKHQITYLAHQAKANEAELQAMWSANRQNRRAAASKYGF